MAQTTPSTPPTGAPRPSSSVSASAAPDPRDLHFAQTLQEAGLAEELNPSWLVQQAASAANPDLRTRRYQILSNYYNEPFHDKRRTSTDGFIAVDADAGLDAHDVVLNLISLCQELDQFSLQRLGSANGPLVLRCGAHFAVVEDSDDEINSESSVTVRSLVSATNSLLAKKKSQRRFVPLRGAPNCEYYLAPRARGAQRLWEAGLLQPLLLSEILEFCNWSREELSGS